MSVDPFQTPRPIPRGIDVTTRLLDFAIVTFAVDPAQLAALLPPGFEPDVVTLDDGRRSAFVSAVPFRDEGFHFAALPWPRFRFPQTNYRAYVRRGDERAVWFFGTTLGTNWVYWPRLVWRLPWHRVRYDYETAWTGDRCDRFRLKARGPWGAAELELGPSGNPMKRLDGFNDAEETALVLTHPLTGYYRTRDGAVGTYSVWHDRLQLRMAEAKVARFEVFEHLGLVASGTQPHSVLVQRETEFIIRLPPQLLSDRTPTLAPGAHPTP